MKFNIFKSMLLIGFTLMFLPAFAIPLVINKFCFSWYFIFLILFFPFYILFFYKNFSSDIKKLMSYNASKFFALFFIWMLISGLYHCLIGTSGLFKSLLSIFMRFLVVALPFVFGFIFARHLGNKKLLKIAYIAIIGVMLFGIYDFIAFYFDIDVLKSIFNFFVSRRLIMKNVVEIKAFANELPRMQSVFEEPCHLACFICAMFPLIYKFSFSKFKIFDNFVVNKIVKFILPILAWTCMIATQSPIYFVIALVVSSIYFMIEKGVSFKPSFKTLGITAVVLFGFILGAKWLINADSLQDTFLYRVQLVLKVMTDINTLILAEQSLGRRLIDIINSFMLFLKDPIMGIGASNLAFLMSRQLANSPVVLVPEVNRALALSPDYYLPTPNIFFSNLAESGIVGITFLYAFFISAYKSVSKILKYTTGAMYNFGFGLQYFILAYIFLSFYDSQLQFPYGLVLIGAALGYSYNIKRSLKVDK